jgi:bifunctional non-homologous end joining protein LigD
MGLEGIVAKRRDKPYRSGRSPDWIKVKNFVSPVRRSTARGSRYERPDTPGPFNRTG